MGVRASMAECVMINNECLKNRSLKLLYFPSIPPSLHSSLHPPISLQTAQGIQLSPSWILQPLGQCLHPPSTPLLLTTTTWWWHSLLTHKDIDKTLIVSTFTGTSLIEQSRAGFYRSVSGCNCWNGDSWTNAAWWIPPRFLKTVHTTWIIKNKIWTGPAFGKSNIFTVVVVVLALILNPHTRFSNSQDYIRQNKSKAMPRRWLFHISKCRRLWNRRTKRTHHKYNTKKDQIAVRAALNCFTE